MLVVAVIPLQAKNINALKAFVREHQRDYVQAGGAFRNLDNVACEASQLNVPCPHAMHVYRYVSGRQRSHMRVLCTQDPLMAEPLHFFNLKGGAPKQSAIG